MDRKTLEYMEERAKKAREIVKVIEKLEKNLDKLNHVESISFRDYSNRHEIDSKIGDLTYELKKVYEDLAKRKIQSLEQQLAEL